MKRHAWVPRLDDRSISHERIDATVFTPMPVRLRNELITQGYGDLAERMAQVVGAEDATWATIGQWASRSIGAYLTLPVPVLGRYIARAFADGNRDVYADIGRAFVTFLDTIGATAEAGGDLDEAWTLCERDLKKRLVEPPGRPGAGSSSFWEPARDPRLQSNSDGYNQYLVAGFRAYRDAIAAQSTSDRSDAVLLGNCFLALHEQRLLSLAISMGFRTWLRTLTTPWRPLQTRRQWRNQAPKAWRLRLEHWWIETATRRFVVVELPDRRIRVGEPVEPTGYGIGVDRSRATALTSVSDDYEAIASLPPRDALALLFDRFDVNGRPAECWNDLADRTAYIFAIFAEHQRNPAFRNDGGGVLRTPEWRPFAAALAQRSKQLHVHSSPVKLASDTIGRRLTNSPLSDRQLDEARIRSSHPLVPGASLLSFATVQDPARQADFFEAVHGDVAERLAHVAVPGGLLDPQVCEVARNLFRDSSTVMFMGLLFRSLPESYAAADGVRVLGAVSDLATDPVRRTGETAQFINDLLLSEDGWEDGRLVADGAAFASVRGVRSIHALVTGQLIANGWDTGADGWPLNQEDVLGAALSFAVPVLEMMSRLAVLPSEEACDGYVQFWLGVGYLLGAPYEAVTMPQDDGSRRPLTYHEARALAHHIRRRHHRRSVDGVRLTEALVEGIGDGLPRSLDWLASGLMSVLGDPAVNRIVLVSPGRGRRRSAVVARVLTGLLARGWSARGTRWVLRRLGGFCTEPFFAEGAGRPYRRPMKLSETRDSRPLVGQVANDYWPVG